MSIFQHPLLWVVFSFVLYPVASQPGQGVQEVKSGQCTSAELIKTAADCQAAAKVLGLNGTVVTGSYYSDPSGCSWATGGYLYFNTNKASTVACGNGTQGTVPPFAGALCLCVNRPCCHAKANYVYSKYEKNCNTIKDATACYLIQFDPSVYTCDWNCDVTTVMGVHNVSQK